MHKNGLHHALSRFHAARTAKMVRWNVLLNNVRGNALKTFIHELGYGDEHAELFFCMEMLDSFSFSYCLTIDIGEAIGNRLGLECHPPGLHSMVKWDAIFSRLVASSCHFAEQNGWLFSMEWKKCLRKHIPRMIPSLCI